MSVEKIEYKWYGWRPGLPDHRNYKFTRFNEIKAAFPPAVSLLGHCPEVLDQSYLGSCTANAGAGLFKFVAMKQGIKAFIPSRLFIYYQERFLEDTIGFDSGASLQDAVKVMQKWGCPPESLWWYNIDKFTVKPNKSVFDAGKKYRAETYQQLNNTNINELKTCLAGGYPFIFGFTVYDSFESDTVAKTGVVPLPSRNEAVLGGHAVMAIGYDDAKQAFLVRNSWGKDWGLNGNFLMPYTYMTNPDLADDFWTIQKLIYG